jgi:hypothetical protein
MTAKAQEILDELTLNYIPVVPVEQLYVIDGGGITIPHDQYEGDDCAADYTWYDVEDWVEIVYDEDEINELEGDQYTYVINAVTKAFTDRYRDHLNSQLRILNGEYDV